MYVSRRKKMLPDKNPKPRRYASLCLIFFPLSGVYMSKNMSPRAPILDRNPALNQSVYTSRKAPAEAEIEVIVKHAYTFFKCDRTGSSLKQ